MKKKAVRSSNTQLLCGQAKPGPKLASLGINMPKLCQELNTKGDTPGKTINIKIKIFPDKTYQIDFKGRSTIDLLKEKSEKGIISKEKIKEIAKIKSPYLNTDKEDLAEKIIAGTARSAGIKIEN